MRWSKKFIMIGLYTPNMIPSNKITLLQYKVCYNNDYSEMPWSFKASQRNIKVVPGETALAFYTVKNKADFAITGVA